MPTAASSIKQSSTRTRFRDRGGSREGSTTMKTQWIAAGSLLVPSLAGGATVGAAAPAAPGLMHVCAAAAPETAHCLADVVTPRPIAHSGGAITGYLAAHVQT